jgi:hypothetical protein
MAPATYRTRLTPKDLGLLARETGTSIADLQLDDVSVELAVADPTVYEATTRGRP